MFKAIRIKKLNNRQSIYKLIPSYKGYDYVLISGIRNEWAHEVMVFPSDGVTHTSSAELAVIRYSTSHEEILNKLGYNLEVK